MGYPKCVKEMLAGIEHKNISISWRVRTSEIQISLRIHTVWQESQFSA